ncbi:MAG: FKBP-type peptidyl-prolyl cis-trans isomerase [Candidatus Paceibacterota bacterium]
MKKTLLTLFLLYAAFIILGFVLQQTLLKNTSYYQTMQSAGTRKEVMLREDFILGSSEEVSFSLDALSISSYVLEVEDRATGGGATAELGDTITVHYTATFEDGAVFDSSRSPGRKPFQFELGAGQAIPGWDEGIPGMRVGGIRLLKIPPLSAYGMKDYGSIPGGSTLYYEIELLSVFD